MPLVAWNPWTDLRKREDVQDLNLTFPFQPIPGKILSGKTNSSSTAKMKENSSPNFSSVDDFSRRIRQSYYAATSYTDSLVGQLLGNLTDLGLRNSTIVVLLGDHGELFRLYTQTALSLKSYVNEAFSVIFTVLYLRLVSWRARGMVEIQQFRGCHSRASSLFGTRSGGKRSSNCEEAGGTDRPLPHPRRFVRSP